MLLSRNLIGHLKKLEDQQRIKAFNETFKTTIKETKEGVFEVFSSDAKGGGTFLNEIEVEEGRIIGKANYKFDTKGWHLSDVIYTQLQLALKEAGKDISQFNLKSWYAERVAFNDTANVAESCLETYGIYNMTFEKDSEEFNNLMNTTTAKSKFYLLKDHFPGKQVTRITVSQDIRDDIYIDYQIE